MKSKHKTHRIARQSRLFPLVAIAGFAVVGAGLYAISNAATVDNPIGVAEFCRLENNEAVIYGWAHDNQAQNSGYPTVLLVVDNNYLSLPTDIAGYRDDKINPYLSANGYTPTSRYGFKVTLKGFYKGSAPYISGTANNYGVGASQALNINTGYATIREAANGGAYFVNNRVPDACLPTAPVVPGPGPTPTPTPTPGVPTPTPTPTPAPGPGTGSGSSGTGSTTRSPSRPTTTNPSTSSPSTETPTTPASTGNFSLNITLLNKGQTLSGITVTLDDGATTAVTDSDGVAVFPGLSDSSYSIRFDYENNTYEDVIGISSEDMQKEIVTQTVDVSELTPLTQEEKQAQEAAAPKKSSKAWLFIFIPLLLIAIAGATIFILRRRNSASTEDYSYPLTTGDTLPQDGANNAGVSLKDLVVTSMREEAARHHKDDKY